MVDRIVSENVQYLAGDAPIDPNSEEYQEVQFHFNTIFNDMSLRLTSPEQKIYGIETPFSLKNKYISLNFEKREKMKLLLRVGLFLKLMMTKNLRN